MEARQSFKGSAVPKTLTIVVGLAAAVGLAVATAVVTRDLAGSSATVKTPVHAAPGTVLRQDNPVQIKVVPAPGTVLRQDDPAESKSGPADVQSGQHSGLLTM